MTGNRFVLRPAKSGDWSILRTMLGDRVRQGRQRRPLAWVAWTRGGSDGALAGSSIAGAAVVWRNRSAARFWVQVVKPYRGQGLGKQLVEHVVSEAKSCGIRTLISQQRIDDTGDASHLLVACGFRPVGRLTRLRCSLGELTAILGPLYERIHARGRIPPDAELIDLDEAEQRQLFGQVARLINTHLGGKHRLVIARMEGRTSLPLDRRGSLVIVHRGRVVAAGLSTFLDEQQAWLADATVVAPEYRGGWVNVWLKCCWVKRMAELKGIDTIMYDVADNQQDTRKLAHKVNGTSVGASCSFVKKLNTSPQGFWRARAGTSH